jgi:F-type H+-transporting ATPase subunit delta
VSAQGAARQYANALFDVAARQGSVDRVKRELADFAALVAGHADLKRVLETPALPMARKRAIVSAVLDASGSWASETRRLLDLLADRDRLALVDDVAAAFAERSMAADAVVRADVTTATPLDDAARASLVQALSKAVGRQVTMAEQVDPSLIGGVVARVGSLVFDGSVSRQLERMKDALLTEG